MVIRNNKKFTCVWYDKDFGYYCFIDNKHPEEFQLSSFKIPWDDGSNFCILIPKLPERNSFSAGNLS
jgi:hypothetical protein